MSDVMLNAVIRMPYEMVMGSEISRLQFYNRAQSLLDASAADKARIAELLDLLREARIFMDQDPDFISCQWGLADRCACHYCATQRIDAALSQQGQGG